MVKFAEIPSYQVEVTEEKIAVYTELLCDLDPVTLDHSCREAAKCCKRFPTPADIREQAASWQTDASQLEAERAWETLQTFGHQHSYDETGNFRDCWAGGKAVRPELPAAIEYAMRQCGGPFGVFECKPENTHFVRRDFMEAYKRFKETKGLQLPAHEAKEILGKVTRQLPAADRQGTTSGMKSAGQVVRELTEGPSAETKRGV